LNLFAVDNRTSVWYNADKEVIKMSIVFNRKIEILLTKEDSLSLDGQSKICNWLYNQLKR